MKEIEITDEMIEDGVAFLQASGCLSFESYELEREFLIGLLSSIFCRD